MAVGPVRACGFDVGIHQHNQLQSLIPATLTTLLIRCFSLLSHLNVWPLMEVFWTGLYILKSAYGLVIIMMRTSLAKVALLLCLFSAALCYTLETTWKLRTAETTSLRSLASPIYFQFSKQLSADGQSTVGYLTIRACNILMYNYEVQDSQIFLTFLSVGRAIRKCANGQIAFLRGQLDETFYFFIMYNTLLLLPPNSDLPIKCDIYSASTVSPPLNGYWIITGALNATVNDPNVVVNGSVIAFCGATHVFNYKVSNPVKINATILQSNSTCNQQILQKFSNLTLAYRINSLDDPQTCSFFDKDSNKILELTYQQDFIINKPITPSIFPIKITSNTSTTPPSKDNPQNNNTQANPIGTKSNQSASISSNNSKDSNASTVAANITVKTSNSSNNNASMNTNSKTNITTAPSESKQTNNTQQSNITNGTYSAMSNTTSNTPSITNSSVFSINSTQKGSNISQSPTLTIKNSSIPSPTNTSSVIASASTSQKTNSTAATSPAVLSEKLVTQASEIFGVWYPSTSIVPNKLKASDITVYQILINAGFLMLRGGCNSIVSPFTFSAGSFTPTKISVTSNSCPVNNDSILQAIIFNPSNLYYLSGSGGNATIRIASPSNATQLILTSNAPSS